MVITGGYYQCFLLVRTSGFQRVTSGCVSELISLVKFPGRNQRISYPPQEVGSESIFTLYFIYFFENVDRQWVWWWSKWYWKCLPYSNCLREAFKFRQFICLWIGVLASVPAIHHVWHLLQITRYLNDLKIRNSKMVIALFQMLCYLETLLSSSKIG